MNEILIIEDEQELRESIEEILRYEGYKTVEAINGREGIEKAKACIPDLILCDIMMPEIDGFGVISELRKNHDFNNVPFVFITALGDRSNTREGMNLGADDYLTKPFTKDELLDTIASKLEKYKRIASSYMSEIDSLEKELSSELKELTTKKESLEKEIKNKDEEVMLGALKIIDANNALSAISSDIQFYLNDGNLSEKEHRYFNNLKSRLKRPSILSNSWTLFQMRFNQTYPKFVSEVNLKHPKLTEYDVLIASAIKSGLNNNQTADLLNIDPDSARKSRYRLKKKFGLGKDDDLSVYIASF